jgi:hypothetical protein
MWVMSKIATEATTLMLARFNKLDHLSASAPHLISKQVVATDCPVSPRHAQMLTREITDCFTVFGLVKSSEHI